MVKNFTIFGERCSGTNFLQEAILENYHIPFTSAYGFKHFFGHQSLENTDDTLFIGIVRNPLDWFGSFYEKPHHLQPNMRKNWNNFLKNECWSVYDLKLVHGDKYNTEIMEDRHWKTKKRFSNIFENRHVKTNYLWNKMPQKVKHYICIRYEDLFKHYREVLTLIEKVGQLQPKFTQEPKPIIQYKGNKSREKYKPKKYDIPEVWVQYIKEHLHKPLEESLGYTPYCFGHELPNPSIHYKSNMKQ